MGRGESTSRKFWVEKLEGGTWLDYNARYAGDFLSWLRLVEFTRSKYRLLVLDTTSPFAVLAVNNVPNPERTILLASYPGKGGTPVSQNTSYASLQLARHRGMHVVLVVDSFVEQLAVFAEEKGLFTGERAYGQVISYLLSFIPDVVDLVQKDAKLGIGVHFLSVLLSGSDKVFKSLDDALAVEASQNSLGGSYERVMSTHLLASSLPQAEKDARSAFGRLSSDPGKSLMNAEFRFRAKETNYGLYDLLLIFGVKEPGLFEDLRRGYQTIASSAPDLTLEGGLAPVVSFPPPEREEPEPEEEGEKPKPSPLSTMKEFIQTRAQVFNLLLQLRSDPREGILAYSTEVPPDRDPLEGLMGEYKDWMDGVFDEFSSALAAEKAPDGEVTDTVCALAYCIGSVQDAIFSHSAEEKRRALDVLAELGVVNTRVEGVSLLEATELLLRGGDDVVKKKA